MGYVFRAKRRAYDNIAAGSAAGEERYVAGGRGYAANATSIIVERLGTSDVATTGQTSHGEQYVAVGGLVSGQSSNLYVNAGGGTSPAGDIPGSTSDSSFWTSGTSYVTGVFPERVG